MNCPQCQTALTMTERKGVEIDFCPRCRGVWLDRGELDKIIERSNQYEGRRDDDHDDDDDDDGDRRRYQQQQPPLPPGYGQAGGYPPNPNYPPPPNYDRRYDQPYKKKKSFWSELFD